jgi:adenylate cyclase
MVSPKTKRNISRIVPFGVIWLLSAIVYSLLEKGVLGGLDHYPSTGNPYNFTQNIFITPISALIAGLLIGTCEILYLNKWFNQKSFTKKIVYKSLVYIVIIILFLIATSAIAQAAELHTTMFDERVWNYVKSFVFSYAFLSVALFMASVIVVSQFYTEVSENIGQGVLNNFLTGRYHAPTEEGRIFMFLDMRSSSTIAEKLGHVKYFEMLREYYSDMSQPIIDHAGEIYQYVGDEIIISWRLEPGQRKNDCIRCFFAIQAAIKKQSGKYTEKFGLLPGFKAGLHVGKVTTGEIGDLKKEIIFTGDVLNTTSRIQALCNDYHVDLIISGSLKDNLELHSDFEIIPLGEKELRGKENRIELFSICPSSG